MKRLILSAIVALVAATAGAKENNDTTVCFSIEPAMHCTNCENKIKENLRYEKGVREIICTAPGSEVKVRYDKKATDTEKLSKAFGKVGFKATSGAVKCSKQNCHGAKPACCKAQENKSCSGKCTAEKASCCKSAEKKACTGKCHNK